MSAGVCLHQKCVVLAGGSFFPPSGYKAAVPAMGLWGLNRHCHSLLPTKDETLGDILGAKGHGRNSILPWSGHTQEARQPVLSTMVCSIMGFLWLFCNHTVTASGRGCR